MHFEHNLFSFPKKVHNERRQVQAHDRISCIYFLLIIRETVARLTHNVFVQPHGRTQGSFRAVMQSLTGVKLSFEQKVSPRS